MAPDTLKTLNPGLAQTWPESVSRRALVARISPPHPAMLGP